jgi:hypothetical protein
MWVAESKLLLQVLGQSTLSSRATFRFKSVNHLTNGVELAAPAVADQCPRHAND